ncbi:MAG: hypothetical protein ABFS02_07525 [Pseudomonadota bacterium]
MTLANATITDNVGLGQDIGGINNTNILYTVNSIIAGNDPNDCFTSNTGTFTSHGFNLFGEGMGCPPGADDVTIDPALVFTDVLGPLQRMFPA